jgi:hypothetical protein
LSYPIRRAFARLTVDASHTVSFQHAGRSFPGLPMTNLSAGGFGMRLPAPVTAGMEIGDDLTAVVFEHVDLPQTKVRGRIVHLLGQRHGPSEGFVLVGVQLVDPPEIFGQFIDQYVRARVG